MEKLMLICKVKSIEALGYCHDHFFVKILFVVSILMIGILLIDSTSNDENKKRGI